MVESFPIGSASSFAIISSFYILKSPEIIQIQFDISLGFVPFLRVLIALTDFIKYFLDLILTWDLRFTKMVRIIAISVHTTTLCLVSLVACWLRVGGTCDHATCWIYLLRLRLLLGYRMMRYRRWVSWLLLCCTWVWCWGHWLYWAGLNRASLLNLTVSLILWSWALIHHLLSWVLLLWLSLLTLLLLLFSL